MWPRKDSSSGSRLHGPVACEAAVWRTGVPAIRPTFTTGTPAAQGEDVAAICRITFNFVADRVPAEKSSKDSAAVACLQEEGPALGHLAQGVGQVAGLACKDEGWQGA